MTKKLAFLAILFTSSFLAAEVAQAPTLQINGFTSMIAAGAKQKDNTNGKGGPIHFAIGSSNIYFTAKGNTAEGFRYKYRAALESYPGGKSVSSGSIYFTQNYIEFSQDSWGIFQFGNLTGPEDTMTESGFNLLGGANTIDGTFGNVINSAEGNIGGVNQAAQTSKAMKAAYYTPTFGGFTLGVSFTPNTTRFGTSGKDNSGASQDNTYGSESGIYPEKSVAAYGLNNIVVGANYKVDFQTWNMALAVIHAQENSKRGQLSFPGAKDTGLDFFKYAKVHRARSSQFTAAVGFGQWRFATGYIHNGKSRLPKTESNYKPGDAGRAWNLGGQYTVGAYQFGLGYFNTSRTLPKLAAVNGSYGAVHGRATSDIVAATVDFNALQGLKFFGEVDVFKMRTNANYAKFVGTTNKYKNSGIVPTVKNSGAAVIVGTKLSF
ncbi:MAG: porin [Alphaproteobacteria bacterium]